MTAQGLPANATRAQALAYLARLFGGYKYHNQSKTPYEGMDSAALYDYIAAKNPRARPHDIAAAVADLLVSSGFAKTIGGVVVGTGIATADIAKGTVAGIDQFASSPLGQLGAFLGSLSQASTWLRVAEGVLGVVLIAIGVARMTSAVPIATKIARSVA